MKKISYAYVIYSIYLIYLYAKNSSWLPLLHSNDDVNSVVITSLLVDFLESNQHSIGVGLPFILTGPRYSNSNELS